MTFEKTIEEIKKDKKVKHESWRSMIVEGFSENFFINLRDEGGWLHYYTITEFTTAFGNLKTGWIVVS